MHLGCGTADTLLFSPALIYFVAAREEQTLFSLSTLLLTVVLMCQTC